MPDKGIDWVRPAERHRQGLELLESGYIEEAVHALREAVEAEPDYAAAWNDLGVVMEALGNARDAVYCYRRALRARPEDAAPRRNLMALALELNFERSMSPPPARRKMAASAGS